MSVRNCAEIGVNLQKIVKRLLANDKLVNLLLEDGLYKMFEEEVEYGEVEPKQINS